MCLGIQDQRLWHLMPSVLPGTTTIFTYSRLLVYNHFHILRHFSKLGPSQSLTDNKNWHLTSLCNLTYTIYILYATHVILIYLFFNKRLPWIRVPLVQRRYLLAIFRFLKNLSGTVIINPKVNRALSIYLRLEILCLLSA